MSKLQEVANLAGVSKATVSRVINNGPSITEKTRNKVTEAMKALNLNARDLKRNNEGTMMIGLIQPFQKNFYNNGFSLNIMLGAEEKAFEYDYMLLIGDNSKDRNKESLVVSKMFKRDVEGLIIQSSYKWGVENFDLLESTGLPSVWVDQKIEEKSVNTVRGDNLNSGIRLMNHLFSLGHKDIAMIGPVHLSTQIDRMRAYQLSMMERGFNVPDRYVITLTNQNLDNYDHYSIIKQLLSEDQRPSALYIIEPKVLNGCIQAINELSLRIPEDISIVTFDESYVVLPETYKNFFTSVNQSGKLIGSMALELLMQHIKHPDMDNQEIILPGTLHVRKSTAPLKKE